MKVNLFGIIARCTAGLAVVLAILASTRLLLLKPSDDLQIRLVRAQIDKANAEGRLLANQEPPVTFPSPQYAASLVGGNPPIAQQAYAYLEQAQLDEETRREVADVLLDLNSPAAWNLFPKFADASHGERFRSVAPQGMRCDAWAETMAKLKLEPTPESLRIPFGSQARNYWFGDLGRALAKHGFARCNAAVQMLVSEQLNSSDAYAISEFYSDSEWAAMRVIRSIRSGKGVDALLTKNLPKPEHPELNRLLAEAVDGILSKSNLADTAKILHALAFLDSEDRWERASRPATATYADFGNLLEQFRADPTEAKAEFIKKVYRNFRAPSDNDAAVALFCANHPKIADQFALSELNIRSAKQSQSSDILPANDEQFLLLIQKIMDHKLEEKEAEAILQQNWTPARRQQLADAFWKAILRSNRSRELKPSSYSAFCNLASREDEVRLLHVTTLRHLPKVPEMALAALVRLGSPMAETVAERYVQSRPTDQLRALQTVFADAESLLCRLAMRSAIPASGSELLNALGSMGSDKSLRVLQSILEAETRQVGRADGSGSAPSSANKALDPILQKEIERLQSRLE